MKLEGRSLWIAGAVVVALLAGAFSAGAFLKPAKVETRIEFRDLTVEDLTRGFTFAKTVEVTRWRKVTTTPTPAGAVIVDESGSHEGSTVAAAETVTDKRTDEHSGSSVQTVTARPDWRVGVLVGASLVKPQLPITGPLVLGVQVERRIIGGVSLGAWVNTVGAAGGVVSLEF